MRVYFLSERPCLLTVNGLALGTVDGHERTAELQPADGLLCEFCCPGFLPVRFFFDEKFLIAPPAGVDLYFTNGSAAVFVGGFLREDASLKLIWQKRIAQTLLTLYIQGRVQLSLENETGFRIIDLPDQFEAAKPAETGDGFVLIAPAAFCILTRTGEVVTLSEGTVSETEPHVIAEIPFHDSLRHTAVCRWEHGKRTDCRVRTSMQPTAATYALALFESVLIGADPTPYLSEGIAGKAASLGEFLGKYTSVVLTETPSVVGLVYARKAQIFDVFYYRVTLEEDGKISNITPLGS